ncbi:ATP-binding protein [Luteolibacter arcticus]|uniref:ATP-binding protein n=1 Tax=Luteolibacter arcticus TaxID=1581411 RepID=A0ABT3GKJ5_9BACT|nr:ATP-binding protein [Luteolibacter arcticus]MCW1924039.1 ATP-binding protein [Luteolibacter arcticus]
METSDDETVEPTSAHTALEGYFYQLKVSVLFALDLLANKQLTNQIILEPVSEEDLEAEFENEPSALTQGMTVSTKRLVVQCKLRSTGPWKIEDLTRLLAHGKIRKPARDRLKEPNISYLLVTSADLVGVARNLAVAGPWQWNHLKEMPATITKALPAASDGRVAVWSRLDMEKVEHQIDKLLTNRFRVPTSKIANCNAKLEQEALARIKGAGGGIWTRADVINIVSNHDGYDGVSRDLQAFVPPTNWEELKQLMGAKNAVVITGPSGTGKTTTAKALIATLRDASPHLTHVQVSGGPEQIRNDITPGSIVYEIEDPWGKYRAEPTALPWNDAINAFLHSASADRKFVITSRSDVLKAADLKSLDKRYTIELSEGHYRKADRSNLFDNRLKAMPRGEQISALKYKADVTKNLLLPLEIERFFGSAALGAKVDETEATFMHRCIDQAKQELIETTLILGIKERNDWEQAAVIWALMKARKRITFGALEELEPDLYGKLPTLEDKLLPFVSFLVAGGNLKQNAAEISYAHPRVEAGLEEAALKNANKTSRVIGQLVDSLIELDQVTGTDWGTETAALIRAAIFPIKKLKVRVPSTRQAKIDNWLISLLGRNEPTFRDDLALAAKSGSPTCAVAELARWLNESPIDKNWFNMRSWKEPEKPQDWYDWLSNEPHTHAICTTFIQSVLGFAHNSFPSSFYQSVAKLSPNLVSAFRTGISEIIRHGYNLNSESLINGALVDLEGFECVIPEAADEWDRVISSHDRKFELAIHNEDLDSYAADHYSESAAEDGYTAGEVLKSYVVARRDAGEWQKLANHQRRDSFIWDWINCVNGTDDFDEAELIAIGTIASNHRHENLFWDAAKKHFTQSLAELLEVRLREGSDDRSIRASAASTALVHAPALVSKLFSESGGLSVERKLELATDMKESLQADEQTTAAQLAVIEKHTAEAGDDLAQAIHLILDFPNAEASPRSANILRSIPDSARPELNLGVARVLARCGDNVSNRIDRILTTTHNVSKENIELVNRAMELGVAQDNQRLITVGLSHEFARCRVTAMNAFFSKSSTPLPPELRDMRRDSSSLVRKRLVAMLEERPHDSHTDALIDLTFDTWTPDHHGQDDVEYPIAEKAAKLLLAQATLSNDAYKRIIKSLKKSDNNSVRMTLLQSMVKHGSPARRDKIVEIAIGEGNPIFQRLSAKALYFQSEFLEERQLDLIADENVGSVSSEVACWLVLTLVARSSDARILKLTESLAINADRSVLNALIYLATFDNVRDKLNSAIANLLPASKISALNDTLSSGDTSDLDYLDYLDDLGEVRMVEEVKDFIRAFA